MKAISLWQPWASLWCSPCKVHETRHWPTNHRGLLLVHATKKIVFDLDEDLEEIVCDQFGGHWAMELPRGALIGVVNIVDCVATTSVRFGDDPDDLYCGDFSPGRFAWQRGEFRTFAQPIPYKGAQGLFDVPDELVREVMEATHA